METKLTLYELAAEDGRSLSPFVWRTKLALAKKGLFYTTRKLAFTDIPQEFGGRFRTVPILDDGVDPMNETWVIADYLDRTFPDRPALFSCPAERAMTEFFDKWLVGSFFPQLLGIYTLDVHNAASQADRTYYRQTREKRLGRRLEEVVAGREVRLAAARAALDPVRQTIGTQSYLGGEEPNYADMAMLGTFIWVGSVGTIPLLAAEDPLAAWAREGMKLFDGAGSAVDLSGLSDAA